MHTCPQTIVLIGPRGSGKSTVGLLLANRTGLPFVDADFELEKRAGRTIREIFASDGEAAFRDLEAEMLDDLLGRGSIVLATGGGVVIRPENRQKICAAGFVVWLTGSVEALWQRVQADPETASRRPDLGVGGTEEIARTIAQREPLYCECADLTVVTDGRSPEQIVNDILVACKTFSS